MSQKQIKIVREDDSQVATVSAKRQYTAPSRKVPTLGQRGKLNERLTSVNQQQNCRNCGKDPQQGKCPAKGTECSYCHKLNYLVAVCRRRTMNSVNVEQLKEDSSEDETLNPHDPDGCSGRLQVGSRHQSSPSSSGVQDRHWREVQHNNSRQLPVTQVHR